MTFAGKLDFLPYGSIVGQFQMVDHSGTLFYGADPIHFNSFNSLEFDGVATRSPPTDVNRATFTASGSDKLGPVDPITFRITDNGEPGKGNEVIEILIICTWFSIIIDGGNFQVHDASLTQ